MPNQPVSLQLVSRLPMLTPVSERRLAFAAQRNLLHLKDIARSMTAKLLSPALRPIFDKVVAARRITEDEAERLYRSNDLNGLGAIANVLRERKNGNVATYIHNQYINYANHCLLSCQFCAFGAKKREAPRL